MPLVVCFFACHACLSGQKSILVRSFMMFDVEKGEAISLP